MPLNGGYKITENDFVYIQPTKDMKVADLEIPKCRGIVIESGYQAKNNIDQVNRFRNHIPTKPKQQTSFRWELVMELKNKTGLPIIVRGVNSGIDALAAVGAGAYAVWVHSNFNGAASPISVLRNVVMTLRGNHNMT